MIQPRYSFENLSDPKARQRETIKISKLLLNRALTQANEELEYLISVLPESPEQKDLITMQMYLKSIRELMSEIPR